MSFEKAAFFGSWFGLILAVQRQPVVVHIQATADTFVSYPGVSGYDDEYNPSLKQRFVQTLHEVRELFNKHTLTLQLCQSVE